MILKRNYITLHALRKKGGNGKAFTRAAGKELSGLQ
jgi:hypothetical protein